MKPIYITIIVIAALACHAVKSCNKRHIELEKFKIEHKVK